MLGATTQLRPPPGVVDIDLKARRREPWRGTQSWRSRRPWVLMLAQLQARAASIWSLLTGRGRLRVGRRRLGVCRPTERTSEGRPFGRACSIAG